MKVLVTGAVGMLGKHVFQEATGRGWDCIARSRLDFNIAFPVAEYEISKIKPDVIINCAGTVPKATPNDIGMILDNAVGPHRLSQLGIRLIHMSSDCVFDDSVYGRSKQLGEVASPNVLNVRGSFVCWESGLLAWLSHQHGNIFGFSRAYWNGTTAAHMAAALCDQANGDRSGFVNVASESTMTKYVLLKQLAEAVGLPVTVLEDTVFEKDRVLCPDIFVPGGEEIIQDLVRQYHVCATP